MIELLEAQWQIKQEIKNQFLGEFGIIESFFYSHNGNVLHIVTRGSKYTRFKEMAFVILHPDFFSEILYLELQKSREVRIGYVIPGLTGLVAFSDKKFSRNVAVKIKKIYRMFFNQELNIYGIENFVPPTRDYYLTGN